MAIKEGINISIDVEALGLAGATKAVSELEGHINSLNKALGMMSKGYDIAKYWRSQESSIDGVTEAVLKFKKASNNMNAEELIRRFNSYAAQGGDISKLSETFGREFDEIMKKAEQLAPAISQIFRVGDLKELFQGLQFIEDAGGDLTNVYTKLREAMQLKGAENQLDLLRSMLEEARSETEMLREELEEARRRIEDLENGSYNRELLRELDELRTKTENYTDIISTMKQEFIGFLRASDISQADIDTDDRIQNALKEIENGAITSKEAIARFKLEVLDASGADTSGLFNQELVQSFVTKFDNVISKLDEMKAGMGAAGNAMAGMVGPINTISGSSSELSDVATIMSRLMAMRPADMSGFDEMYESMSKLVNVVKDLSGAGVQQLNSVYSVLSAISKLNGIKIGDKALENVLNLLNRLNDFEPSSGLNSFSTLDFSKIQELNSVKPSALNALAAFLEAASNIRNIQSIEALSHITFDGASIKDVDNKSLSALSNFYLALKDIKNAAAIKALGEANFKGPIIEKGVGPKKLEALANFYTLMGSIKHVDNIEKLSNISFENLSNLKISKTYINNFAELVGLLDMVSTGAAKDRALGKAYNALTGQASDADAAKASMTGLTEDTEEYRKILEKAMKLYADVQTNHKKWADAQDGQSKEYYKQYVEAGNHAKEIMDKLVNGDYKMSDVGAINDELSEMASTAKIAADAIRAVGENTSTIHDQNISDAADDMTVLKDGVDGYSDALVRANKMYADIQTNQRKWSDAETGQAHEAYQAYVEVGEQAKIMMDMLQSGSFQKSDLQYIISELDRMATEAKLAADAIRSVGENTSTKTLVDGTAEYERAVTTLSNLRQKIQDNSDKWAPFQTEGSKATFEEYAAIVSRVDELQTKLSNGGLKRDDYATELEQLKRRASELEAELKKLGVTKDNVAKGDKPIIAGSKEYASALDKISKKIAEVRTNQEKWTAARDGRSKNAYANYVMQADALEELAGQLKAGAISADEFAIKYAQISATMSKSKADIVASGEATAKFGDKLKGLIQRFGVYFSMTEIVMATINTAKRMVQASMDIEVAMKRIQIVTGATDKEMSKFFETAAGQAKELGKSITEVASSIETFSRLGFDLPDASELAKFATIMSNVADVEVEEATTGLTSIIKGYDMDASNIEHVSDVLIKVGQEYAISAGELMEAFERGGAALYASGTTFEQSAGLFAATNAALQNASTTG